MNTERTNRLLGKVALVTGAGSREGEIGNGCATAVLLARAGARLVLVDLNREWVETTRKMIDQEVADHKKNARDPKKQNGKEFDETQPNASIVIADVTKAEDCQRAVQVARDTFGRLDILVNIVGIDGPDGTAVDVDMDAWDRAMKVNVTSMVLMAKYALPEMLRSLPKDISRGSGKAIVNMSSVAGLQGGHHALLYPTSKGAIVNLTKAMAAHHGLAGIRVNAVAPGMIYTPMVTHSKVGMSKEMREARKNRSLLKTEGYAWDVGNAIVFLCSEEARWITGTVLAVDAGATAGYTAGSKFGEPGAAAKL